MSELMKALVSAQGEFPVITNDKENPHFRSSYASLGGLVAAVRPILVKHGLGFVWQHDSLPSQVSVSVSVFHESGEVFKCPPVLMPVSKPDAQGTKSAITYAKRVSFESAFGLAPLDDDDGNAASARTTALPAARQREESGREVAPEPPKQGWGHLDPEVFCTFGKNGGKMWSSLTDRQIKWYAGIGPDAKKDHDSNALAEWTRRQSEYGHQADHDAHQAYDQEV